MLVYISHTILIPLLNNIIFIHLSSVPVPTPSISVSRNSDVLYAGTTLSLTCDYTLSPSVDTTPQTAVTWMVDGVAVDTSPGRISTDGATLSFSPLATSDTGSYTCTLTVTTSQTHVTVQGPVQSAQQSLLVQGRNDILTIEHFFYSI